MEILANKFKTWLPLFDGFYNTWYDPSYFFDDRANDFYEETEVDLIIDNNLFNFDDFKTDVINKHVEIVERELKDLGLVESITFERLNSPKFYNYRNDSVDVEIEMLPKNIVKLQDYVMVDFFSILYRQIEKDYKSRDGFISLYPNDLMEWEIETNGFTDFTKNEHYLGALLELILTYMIDTDHITDEVLESLYLTDYIEL